MKALNNNLNVNKNNIENLPESVLIEVSGGSADEYGGWAFMIGLACLAGFTGAAVPLVGAALVGAALASS